MKILIVRLSALGDIVHALPVLAAIKKAMPGAEVSHAPELVGLVAVWLLARAPVETPRQRAHPALG